MRRRDQAAAALLAIALAGCPRTPPETPPRPGPLPACEKAGSVARRACRKDWTLLVFMAADDEGLAAEAIRDLDEMETPSSDPAWSAASTPRADVVIELDTGDPSGIRRIHVERAAGRIDVPAEQRTAADIRSPSVARFAEEAILPEERLRRFLSWGATEYPSDHHAVVVWGHGLGYRPKIGGDARWSPRGIAGGIAFDRSRGTVLDTPSLRGALAVVSKEQLAGKPFDLYASDACLMQSLEVATELAGVARYIVGSEQIEDWSGLPYRSIVPLLNGSVAAPAAAPCGADDGACRIAAAIPGLGKAALAEAPAALPRAPETRDAFTLSSLDARALMTSLVPAMHRVGAAIQAFISEEPLRKIDLGILLAPEGAANPALGLPGFLGGTRDTGVFLTRLEALVRADTARSGRAASAGATRLLSLIGAARSAIAAAVIARSFGARYEGDRWAGMAGVSVWLPHDAAELRARGSFFAQSRLYTAAGEDSAWRPWMLAALGP